MTPGARARFPAHTAVLRTGARVVVRPLEAGDGAALAGVLGCAPAWIGVADQAQGLAWRQVG